MGYVRLGSNADSCSAQGHVCFWPKADVCNTVRSAWANAGSCTTATALQRSAMNSRRFMFMPKPMESVSYRLNPRALNRHHRCPLWAKSGHAKSLIDYFIGAAEQRRRHGETEHSRS